MTPVPETLTVINQVLAPGGDHRNATVAPCGDALLEEDAVSDMVLTSLLDRTTRRRHAAAALACTALAWAGSSRAETPPDEPAPQRQRELLRVVRQECGACHGLRLTGGLGPALTRQALADKPIDSMAATIFGGRPGTPMPPWRAFLSAGEAHWIAHQLALGLPADGGAPQ